MRYFPLALLMILRSLTAADGPDKILAQHVAAVGGAKALKARDSVEYRGESRDAAGERASFTLALHAPNLIYLELAAGTGGWSEADNGKSAWRRDSAQGLRTLSGADSKQLRTLAYFLNAGFVDYKRDKWSPAATGDAIEMSNEASELAGARVKFHFDSASRMLLQMEQPDGWSMEFSDYRPVNGVREPFHMVLHRGTQNYDITVSEVVPGKQLDLHTFDYPGAAISNAPEMGKLLEELSRHQNDMRSVRRLYSCTLEEVSEDVDGKGKVSKTTNERYYLFYLGNRQFRKHTASNGRALSEAEVKKEDERLGKEQKQWEERRKAAIARRQAEAARKGTQPAAQRNSQQDSEDADMIRDVLKVMQFSNFRREPFRGREVLVFDFSPKPGYKPQGLKETLVSKFIGTMWVDEADHQVARVQARSSGSFKVGGGLVASLDSGSSFVVEQEKVNNEVWVPALEEIHLSAHLLLFKSEKANETDRYSDYKKFTADSTVTFGEIAK